MPASEPLGIGLLGFGTVGSAVHRLLVQHAGNVERVAGRPVRVVRALVRDPNKPRDGASDGLLTTDFADLRDDPRVAVVAELMGGVEPTRGYLLELLERGTSVVSANKQLLARHGEELFAAAERGGAQLRFEASVCAAIPVVKVLRESLVAADVREVLGIVNGTTNFVLTAMTRDGQSYADALHTAQELGYAEADPTEDVGGADAAAKLAILASIAFHARVGIDDVPFAGIDNIEAADVELAAELGYAVKLLARARLGERGIAARVAPTLVPFDHALAGVEGSTNAVVLRGEAIREILLVGPGAGGKETASAVLGDLLGVLATTGTGFLQHDGYYRSLPLLGPGEDETALYVRLTVEDRPGVLAQIASIFGSRGVSIESLVQRPAEPGTATLVLLTHVAREDGALEAVAEIAGLPLSRDQPRILHVLPR